MERIINIPNAITSLRIVGSVILCWLIPMSLSFFICYAICAMSDIADGFLARHLKMSSPFGAVLDSVADIFFAFAILITLIPLLHISVYILFWIVGISLLRIVSIGIASHKYHKLVPGLHTYLNKLAGLFFYSMPISYYIFGSNLAAFLICGIATLSALEEMVIHIISKRLNADVKGMWDIGMID